MTIELPDELAFSLEEIAKGRGVTSAELAIQALRQVASEHTARRVGRDGKPYSNMLEALAPYIGKSAGTGEAFSQNGGKRFADDLAAGRRARP